MKKVLLIVPVLMLVGVASLFLQGQGEHNPNRLPCTYPLKKQVNHADEILEITITASKFLPEVKQCEYDVTLRKALKGEMPDAPKEMKIYDDGRTDLPIRGELSKPPSCDVENANHLLFLHSKYSDEFFQNGTMNCRGGVFLRSESDKLGVLEYIK